MAGHQLLATITIVAIPKFPAQSAERYHKNNNNNKLRVNFSICQNVKSSVCPPPTFVSIFLSPSLTRFLIATHASTFNKHFIQSTRYTYVCMYVLCIVCKYICFNNLAFFWRRFSKCLLFEID